MNVTDLAETLHDAAGKPRQWHLWNELISARDSIITHLTRPCPKCGAVGRGHLHSWIDSEGAQRAFSSI